MILHMSLLPLSLQIHSALLSLHQMFGFVLPMAGQSLLPIPRQLLLPPPLSLSLSPSPSTDHAT